MGQGDHGLTFTEILNTPVRDLFMLRDVNDEIQILKQKMLEEASKNGGEVK